MFEALEKLSALVQDATKLTPASDSANTEVRNIQRCILGMADAGRHNTAMAVRAASAVEQLLCQATKFVHAAEGIGPLS
ncbi:hypothetical protein GTP81_08450 [Rugamonas sp. FT107W]|uniref:Uncharacterized protein n=1 Tax=Duganella vulcania TaxID=2692166 RepID=A0A845HDE0_9BURK|nr:hypothetical protein [Duganella vulcania]MYN16781.1 hypothetical protein [Duganella vulcania]